MKTEEQIAARINELSAKLKENEDRRKDYAKRTGANRTNLGMRRNRELDGEIAALRWVLDTES